MSAIGGLLEWVVWPPLVHGESVFVSLDVEASLVFCVREIATHWIRLNTPQGNGMQLMDGIERQTSKTLIPGVTLTKR